ncbi:TPA: polysaccharide biosynthesis C-terminal domain-containing protein [Enterococcus faecium]
MIGAIVNLILNFLLIPVLSLTGASISSAMSFLVVWIIRVKDTKRFVNMHIELKKMIVNHIFLLLQITLLFSITSNLITIFFTQLPFFITMLLYNSKNNKLLTLLASKIKK